MKSMEMVKKKGVLMGKGEGRFWGIVSPCVVQLVVTGMAILLLAGGMFWLGWGEQTMAAAVLAVYGVACVTGGWMAGRRAEKRKFLKGMLYGGIYYVLLCFLSLAGGGAFAADTMKLFLVLAVCVLAGMAGGILSGL